MFGPFADQLSAFLADFLSEKPESGERLCSFLRKRVGWYCAAHAPTLPLDMREDVLQETILVLHARGAQCFNASEGTAAGYVYHIVRGALKSVIRRHGLSHDVLQSETNEGIDLLDTMAASLTSGSLPTPSDYEHRELAAHALELAGPVFGRALWRVYVNEERREQVLAEIGMSRFVFDRRKKAVKQSLLSLPRSA